MMKRILILLLTINLVGCATKKEVLYFQDIREPGTQIPQPDSIYQYPEIQVNDILKIDITALDEESVMPFKFEKLAVQGTRQLELLKLEGYVVDKNGTINYPQLGQVDVAGKTTQQLQKYLEELLSVYIKDPTVKVRLLNFKISILGEVNNPGTYTLTEESITLPQALGLAGDLTIKGKRENVLIMRTVDGVRKSTAIDMTQTDWMDSPYFYLKQNDVIYVSPNGPKVASAGFIGNVGTLLSVVSILLSAVVLLAR
ncbi:MAG TPA: polysaccharide biosynthesis/export family protein [Flavobacteriaceae bacterium]|nr:polysaccharide biosynthesis/export family protein [Flavobacteriaceae bacterium]